MVSGDEHDGGFRQRFPQPLELPEGKDDGVVGRSNGMEEVARNDNDIGAGGDDPVNSGPKSLGDVRLALIDAARRLPVILPESQVQVGNVGQFQSSPSVRIVHPMQSRNPSPGTDRLFRHSPAQAGVEERIHIVRPLAPSRR